MPTFVDQRIHELLQIAGVVEPAVQSQENRQPSARQTRLHGLLSALNTPPSTARIRSTLDALHEEQSVTEDPEEWAYVEAIQCRILVGLYGNAMQRLLEEAIEADDAARWWWRVEKSKRNSAWFMVQTFPQRVYALTRTIIASLRTRNVPISLSLFSPSSFRQLFPPSTHPSELITSIFPHLSSRSHVLARSPLHLTREECKDKRKQLEQLRNERAATLGRFAVASQALEADLTSGKTDLSRALQEFEALGARMSLREWSLQGLNGALESIDLYHNSHTVALAPLQRPSRLVLLWPRLLLIPPITYFVLGWAWSSREDIKKELREGMDTARAFYQSWLVEPIRSILATVRTGGDEGVRVISKDALKADMDSLERMVTALSMEKLNYSDVQIAELTLKIREGDLTPVLRVYEEDIKQPIRSAITGTLVRSLLIQIQKMKVDVDFALSGIDKLLRSQELTFGFVGVAPALAITYVFLGWVRSFWSGGRGRGAYGGRKERENAWLAMRRVERLLVVDCISEGGQARAKANGSARADGSTGTLSPTTQGLLLLYLTHLRGFAEKHLRESTRFREGFLEDIEDLEDTRLGREEKRMVVRRMWESWGAELGWRRMGKL